MAISEWDVIKHGDESYRQLKAVERKPMSVFTIFNHGTASDRDTQASEIVSLLSGAMEGSEALIVKDDSTPLGYSLKSTEPSFMICEGPGSAEFTEEESKSGVAHTWPGRDNPITRDKAKDGLMKQQDTLKKKAWYKGGGNTDFQKSFYGDTPRPWQVTGLVSGKGWNDNVYKAVWMLTHLLFGHEQSIDTVNIIGWSRGAVTCLKQAHLLAEVLPQLNINILAMDPVPGMDPLSHEADTKTITSNVKTYWAILALNERRMNFRCVDPSIIVNNSPDAWVEYLPMPGNHSDVVRPNADTLPSLRYSETRDGLYSPKSYKIVLNIVHRFLTHFGTPLKVVDQPSNTNCLAIYNDMLTNIATTNKEYDDFESWTDISAVRLGWRYDDRAILTKYNQAQQTIPQQGVTQDPYHPYVLNGWINTHHWILEKNSKNGKPNPKLDYPFVNVNEDRIKKWETFLGIR